MWPPLSHGKFLEEINCFVIAEPRSWSLTDTWRKPWSCWRMRPTTTSPRGSWGCRPWTLSHSWRASWRLSAVRCNLASSYFTLHLSLHLYLLFTITFSWLRLILFTYGLLIKAQNQWSETRRDCVFFIKCATRVDGSKKTLPNINIYDIYWKPI